MSEEEAGASAGANAAATQPRIQLHQQQAVSSYNANGNLPPNTTFTIQPPEPFDFSKPQQWEKWIRRFERFRLASNLHQSSEANQVNTLIYCMGDEADDILRGQALSDMQRQQYLAVRDTLDTYFVPRKNTINERARFNQRIQQVNETVDSFVTALYALAENCRYGALHDELIRDRLVVGLRDTSLAERLQLDKDLTLEKAVNQARQSETIKRQQTDIRGDNKLEIDAVFVKNRKQKHPTTKPHSQPKYFNKDESPNERSCYRCGKTPAHGKFQCPAKDVTCHTCGKRGHYSKSDASGAFREDDSSSSPQTLFQDMQCDSRGFPGWEAVDNLAEYLLNLNRTITALSTTEVAEIMRLYSALHAMDKRPTKYTLKSKRRTLPGRWRASRKRSGSAPGQQAAERLFMTHGQAAQRPDTNRISECVRLKLLKEYKQARNRPKDCKGKVLSIAQSIVQTYCHVKQLLEDCQPIQDQTNLLLVTINNTTVCAWLHERQKKTDRDALLQEVQLPQKVSVAENSLPEARQLPSIPVEYGHKSMEFQKPENREDEAVIRPRGGGKTDSAQHCPAYARIVSSSSYQQAHFHPAPSPTCFLSAQDQQPPSPACSHYEQNQMPQTQSASGFCYSPSAPVWSSFGQGQFPPQGFYLYCTPPLHTSTPTAAAGVAVPSTSSQLSVNMNRHRRWRQNKAELEDRARLARGEPPKKRQWKPDYHYQCSVCSQTKNKSTGHTQIKGKWYCPASGQTLLQWKESLSKQ